MAPNIELIRKKSQVFKILRRVAKLCKSNIHRAFIPAPLYGVVITNLLYNCYGCSKKSSAAWPTCFRPLQSWCAGIIALELGLLMAMLQIRVRSGLPASLLSVDPLPNINSLPPFRCRVWPTSLLCIMGNSKGWIAYKAEWLTHIEIRVQADAAVVDYLEGEARIGGEC